MLERQQEKLPLFPLYGYLPIAASCFRAFPIPYYERKDSLWLMEIGLFWRGIGIGFAIAAPVGPIGMLCIQQTLVRGRWFGLVAGLGAASADAIYGCIAAFGLGAISSLVVSGDFWLRLGGGLFLCYLGIKTFMAPAISVAAIATSNPTATLPFTYATTFGLTLTNPATIILFSGIFAGLGATQIPQGIGAIFLVFGVFCGSAMWWFLLSSSVGLLHGNLSSQLSRQLNRLCGVIFLVFGAIALTTVP